MILEPEDEIPNEGKARIEQLTEREIALIDAALIGHVGLQSRKVALVISLAMEDCRAALAGVPDAYYSRRVAHLVSEGKLIAFGDLRHMRYSEICLP